MQAKKSYIIKRPIPFIVYEAITFMNNILKPEHDTLWYKTVNDYAQSVSFNKQVIDQFGFQNTQKEATWALLDKTENESFDLIFIDARIILTTATNS